MLTYQVQKTEILIIGAGMTGLRAAVEASSLGREVLVLARGAGCSWGIGGFNAAVGKEDDAALYYSDICKSGCGVNDPALGRILAEHAQKEVDFLQGLGMEFDRREDGSYELLQPLGCSVPRLVHCGSDTGTIAERIFQKILQERGVPIRRGVTVVELLSDGEHVYGAVSVEEGKVISYQAKAVVLAAGGIGHLYPISTYPAEIQGDSYAMLIRAGAKMIDMEFMQFEPCCLVEPPELYGRGISTTMLAAGATLRNARGEELIPRYFSSMKEVQKGELSRAVYAEIQSCGKEPVWYDMTGLTRKEVDAHCIYSRQLRERGYDLSSKPVKVVPAAHTFLGGAYVDTSCRTSLRGLYAAGEAMGGLHGANRIGGCAGAETFVFGAVAGKEAAEAAERTAWETEKHKELTVRFLHRFSEAAEQNPQSRKEMTEKLQSVLMQELFLLRDEKGLAGASALAAEVAAAAERAAGKTSQELLEAVRVKNMAWLIRFIAEASLLRKESRGVFFRKDYPQEDTKRFCASFVMKKEKDQIGISRIERSNKEKGREKCFI